MWKDYLYFSKGERRALLILVGLLSVSLGLLIFTDSPRTEIEEPPFSKQSMSYEISKRRDKPDLSEPKKTADSQNPTPQVRYPKQHKSYVADKPGKYENRQKKYPLGTVVDLNKADTSELKCIPGIGSTYATRIVKFRNLLGGFHSVEQLKEVYGIDEEKFDTLKEWFTVNENTLKQLLVNQLPEDSIRKHPYIDYRQAKVLVRLRKKIGKLSGWDNLLLLEEFTEADKSRLIPYLSFD